jgi:hypothetical protein
MAKKSATKAQTKTEAPAAPKTFKLADLARDNGKDPKAVRSRFRNLYKNDNEAGHPAMVKDGGSKWVFRESDRDAITALMNGSTTSDD